MRQVKFPVRSLGSEKPAAPTSDELADWIHNSMGSSVDLITWEIETTLHNQLPYVSIPTAGGVFYQERLLSAFPNVSDKIILAEFDLEPEEILNDCHRTEKIAKHCWWSLPSPSELGMTDKYFGDSDDTEMAVTEALQKICRIQRDAGAEGHILTTSVTPTTIELERLIGKKYLWFGPKESLEHILEVQRDLILPKDAVSSLENLVDSYTIRSVLLQDPDETALNTVIELFDPEDVIICGTAPASEQKKYWENLADLSIPAK